jgi:two-component system sensor histidine kinase DegS
LITAARLELRATRLLAGENLPAPAEEKMAAARQVLGEIEGELRRAIYDLHPPILDAVGLAPAIEKYVTRFQEFSGIPTRFQITGFPRRLQSSMEIAIFRIVEESLHNIVTHAEATNASVSLDFGSDRLCIIVEDDGHGFSATLPVQSQSNSGLGLFGMQERIRNLNGHMEVESERGHGTRLIFQLPIGEAES